MKLFTRQGTCHSVTVYTYKNLNIKNTDNAQERGERDYVKGNQLCFCLKRWKTITVKRIVFIKFQLIKG